ncbi:helix-turn-helix domain-containing protein [Sphingomonas bacterium]|uniref:winged helix-turn-helix transcriptional regulator n=1 Tax=Sphingomonas bacterium TaxID=1895847 RepID=UPI0020C6286D|nr:helix-turn-helix domain-containing protein [Sphingomonas bacterium]
MSFGVPSPGISQHMLTSSLRELEDEGILYRQVFAEVPPHVEYRLTPHGTTLGEVLRAMAEWGGTHFARAR